MRVNRWLSSPRRSLQKGGDATTLPLEQRLAVQAKGDRNQAKEEPAQRDSEFLKFVGDIVRIERLGQDLQMRVVCEARANVLLRISGGQNDRQVRT
jgi:hypothetical protein